MKILNIIFATFVLINTMPYEIDAQGTNPHKLLYQLADSLGTGLGQANWIGDYSSTPDTAFIQPPSNDVYHISSIVVLIEDATAFGAEGYGALSVLTNGIKIRVADDTGELFVVTPELVHSNAEWGLYATDHDYESFGGGNNFYTAEVHFWDASGNMIVLDNTDDSNPRIEIILQDNFTGLVAHRFMFVGHQDDSTY